MAIAKIPEKAKLFIGYITEHSELADQAKKILAKKYGVIDIECQPIAFSHTKYYNNIGENLYKYFLSFKKLIKREDIVKIKLHTNKLEEKLSPSNKRIINIDPGYLTLSNIYLASCKEYFHRMYLNKGIYLENEFKYTAKKFVPWEWTYPDYLKKEYIDFFHEVRRTYYKQIRSKN